MTEQQKQEFIDSFAPAPRDDRKWDAVFLFDEPQFEDLFGWFWAVFVCDDGELHEEWVNHQRRVWLANSS